MRATLLLLIALLLSQVFCATYYLSSIGGSDVDGNGSEDKPFQTIAKVLNTTENPTETIELYFYPGSYGGVDNTAFNFTGPLTINWVQNTSLAEGDSDLVQFDCTAASDAPCFFSNTSITLNGLDSDNIKITFEDCSTCIAVDNSAKSDNINGDYFITVNGVSFNEVSQGAIIGQYLHSVEITDSYFSDGQAGGLTLIGVSVIEDEFTVQNTQFNSLNKNALLLANVTKGTVENCTFTNSFVFISGKDYKESQVVLDSNTYAAADGISYIVNLQTGTFTIKDSKFTSQQTGCVQVVESDTTSLINSTFSSGIADNGGAGYFENVTSLTISENCLFTSNTAALYGGAIYLVNSTAHLDATNFTDNAAVDGSAIGCTGNETTVIYDNTTVFFTGSQGSGPTATYIQNTCKVEISTFASSLVVSSLDSGSDAWIWILVSIAILVVILIIIAAVGFVIYQRKRQSYTRMD